MGRVLAGTPNTTASSRESSSQPAESVAPSDSASEGGVVLQWVTPRLVTRVQVSSGFQVIFGVQVRLEEFRNNYHSNFVKLFKLSTIMSHDVINSSTNIILGHVSNYQFHYRRTLQKTRWRSTRLTSSQWRLALQCSHPTPLPDLKRCPLHPLTRFVLIVISSLIIKLYLLKSNKDW